MNLILNNNNDYNYYYMSRQLFKPTGLTEYEEYLLEHPQELSSMNNLLFTNQFSEEFLIKSRLYYDSWKCLRSQNDLSPYFCFMYLYDRQEYDSADDWTDYNQVYEYLKKRNYSDNFIEAEFERALNDRDKE